MNHCSSTSRLAIITGALVLAALPAVAVAPRETHVKMRAQTGSHQRGNATIMAVAGGVRVSISVAGEPNGASEPAHIHAGGCPGGTALVKPLKNVINGMSVTTVEGMTIEQFKRAKYSLNVHKSSKELQTYVSCGDI